MKSVLFLNPFYYPGFRSGGPQRTLMNIVDAFGDKANIYILTQNVDLGVAKPYASIPTGEWVKVGKARVKYLRPCNYDFKHIRKEYLKFDTIYSCGLFDINTVSVLLIHKLAGKERKKLYVAPMGVFSPKALAAKALKKQVFLWTYKVLGMFRSITWSFTSEMEQQHAINALGERVVKDCIIAEDLPRRVDFEESIEYLETVKKKSGKIRIIFLSRISPQKNLLGCLEILACEFAGQIEFDIYGPLEDPSYWEKCKDKMNGMPQNVMIKYCGEVRPESVIETFIKYDAFLFPTKGENYGHVIYEALAAGCIPIISDQTPWNDLVKENAGYICSLSNLEQFQNAIKQLLLLDSKEYRKIRKNAINVAKKKVDLLVKNSEYRSILL